MMETKVAVACFSKSMVVAAACSWLGDEVVAAGAATFWELEQPKFIRPLSA